MSALAAVLLATVVRAQYLMGTTCEISAPSAPEIEAAFAEGHRVERMLSTWIGESELSRLNRGEVVAGPELRRLLDLAAEWSRKTDRAFDPQFREDRAYDSGAFGKGYALDRMLALTQGDVVIDFGGQLIVRGQREVAIADPVDRQRPVVALRLTNASLSTSGDSEQPGHIVDPRTGRSVRTRGSVSVIATDALTADILSTALYVMGEERGLRWADANGVVAIFINESKVVRRSKHAPRELELLDTKYTLKD